MSARRAVPALVWMGLALCACADVDDSAGPEGVPASIPASSGPVRGAADPNRVDIEGASPRADLRASSTAPARNAATTPGATRGAIPTTGPELAVLPEEARIGEHWAGGEARDVDSGDAERGVEARDVDSGDEERGVEAEDEASGEPTRARLCSRPYTLSGTPGKGASRGVKSQADYAEAMARLRGGFDVAVDGGERQRWTPEEGVEIDGLDPSRRHTVIISAAGGKRVRKLVLDFRARGSDDLCLGFNDFYNTWQIRKLRSGRRCGPCVTR